MAATKITTTLVGRTATPRYPEQGCGWPFHDPGSYATTPMRSQADTHHEAEVVAAYLKDGEAMVLLRAPDGTTKEAFATLVNFSEAK